MITKIEAMIQLVASINQGGSVPPRLVVGVARKQLKEIFAPQLAYGGSSPEILRKGERILSPDEVELPPISQRVQPKKKGKAYDIEQGFLMGFGKHSALQVEEVMRKHPAYLTWVHGNTTKSFDPEILICLGLDAKPEADEDPTPPTDFNVDTPTEDVHF